LSDRDLHSDGTPSPQEQGDTPAQDEAAAPRPGDTPEGGQQADSGAGTRAGDREQPPIDDWKTQIMPADFRTPEYIKRVNPPQRARTYAPLVIALSALLLLAVLAGGVYAYQTHGGFFVRPTPRPTCPACAVTENYLADYTGGKYEAMYKLVSQATIQKFSDKNILGSTWKDAHDYIVNRTAALVGEARITSMEATPGKVTLTNATTASVPVRVTMDSTWVGTIIQNITIPLVYEHGAWKVNWTPGLIFTALDDPADPYYQRRLRLLGAEGMRGTIYDMNNVPLAQDQQVFTVGVVPGQIKNEPSLLATLSVALGMPADQIKGLYTGKPAGSFVRIRTLSTKAYQPVQNIINTQTQNGAAVQTDTERVYPYGADAAAITGYVSVVTADDLKNDTAHFYGNADMVGRSGVEQWAEQYLRPGRGGQLVVRDINADGSDGRIENVIADRTPTNGDDVHTSISIAAQEAAINTLRGFQKYSGSTAALDPATGEVRVLASYPMYNPNDFSQDFAPGINALNSLDHPYLDRAVGGSYPIGSVFKVITLTAAMENGISPTQVFSCPGSYLVPGETKPRPDDDPHGHGNLTVPQALPPSCDVVFWKVAVLLNQKDPYIIPKMARAFGLGAATGIIGLPQDEENAGQVPDPAYYQSHKNAQWTPTDATNLAIGQGDLLVTPLQIAGIAAAVANNGVRMRPRLVTSITSPTGAVVQTYPAEEVGKLPVSASTLSIVQTAMVSTTITKGGTSYNELHNFPVLIAAKTGTAESSSPAHPMPPHSCYTAYAPASPLSGPPVAPKIAVGAVVEHSGLGEKFALPVVESILRSYLNLG